ncbi:TIGR03086 family metal-binding protein [Nocardioides litoris]|uniref:TIGR03086 family metal-binding protein n=1 Tax=Nocardioides litoris TaxID=1926648 RepID=UPI00111E14E3|nr:TIGR03086 family metal-binding protein [Nocardioides litoris]
MTQQTPPLTDPRPALLAAAAQLTPYVEGVGETDLDRPTPCDGWVVRDLLAHLLAVADRVPHVLGGGHPSEVPSMVGGLDDAAGLVAGWTDRQPALAAALADDDLLGRTVHHPAGDMPAAAAIGTYVSELLVHAWDLAAALGDTSGLDDRQAEACLPAIVRALPAEIRGEEWVPFGEVVPVADDARATDRLVAWVGRDPGWRAG